MAARRTGPSSSNSGSRTYGGQVYTIAPPAISSTSQNRRFPATSGPSRSEQASILLA